MFYAKTDCPRFHHVNIYYAKIEYKGIKPFRVTDNTN